MMRWRMIAVGAACGALVGCQASRPPARTMDLRVGQTGEFALPMTAGTGFSWTLDSGQSTGLSCVALSGGESVTPAERVGGAGEQQWRIEAQAIGQAELVFEYRRPWESDAPAAKSATVRVSVR